MTRHVSSYGLDPAKELAEFEEIASDQAYLFDDLDEALEEVWSLGLTLGILTLGPWKCSKQR